MKIKSLLFTLLLLIPLPSLAQELMFQDVLLGEDVMTKKTQSFDYSRTGVFDEARGAAYLPLHQSGNTSLLGFVRGQRMTLDQDIPNPQGGTLLPQEFGNAEVGLSWRKINDDGVRYGVTGDIGSAGRQIFASDFPPNYSLTASMEKRRTDGNSWLFFLIANQRNVRGGIVPGFGYVMRGPDYRFIFGLPLVFMMWNPKPFQLRVMATPFTAQSEVSYLIKKDFEFFTGFSWDSKEYNNLVDNSADSVFIRVKELNAGLRYTVNENAEINLGYVYGFDRRLYIGSDSNQPDYGPVEIPDGGGAQLKFSFHF